MIFPSELSILPTMEHSSSKSLLGWCFLSFGNHLICHPLLRRLSWLLWYLPFSPRSSLTQLLPFRRKGRTKSNLFSFIRTKYNLKLSFSVIHLFAHLFIVCLPPLEDKLHGNRKFILLVLFPAPKTVFGKSKCSINICWLNKWKSVRFDLAKQLWFCCYLKQPSYLPSFFNTVQCALSPFLIIASSVWLYMWSRLLTEAALLKVNHISFMVRPNSLSLASASLTYL